MMRDHKPISIADQVFEKLERDILSGKYPQGEILSELRLSGELGVSRTPIREAIRRLEQERILEDSGHGLVVIGISRQDMRLPHYDIHNPSPFYRFQQAQPLAISNVATRNINSPVGKMAAMRMPAPMAMANIPMMQFRPPRNTRLRLLSLQPNI